MSSGSMASEPEDLEGVVFLASAASDYVDGALYSLDGGRSAA